MVKSSEEESSLGKDISIKKASAIYAGAKYTTIFVGILISAVLSRILTPDDYGVVAVVTVFSTFFSTLANLGLGTGLIQNKNLSKEDTNDIYSFSVWFSIILSLLLCFAAKPIATFYNDRAYMPICYLLSISVLFNSLNMIPNSMLLKEQKFFSVGIRMIVSSVGSGIVAIIMAVLGWKYYSLVFQSILLAAIQFFWNRMTVQLKFKLKINFQPIKSIANYSLNQFFYNVLNMFAQNLDNLLTGKFMGSEQLAYYNKSYTLMRYPVNNIPHAISPILHPILSNYQNDKKYIYEKYIEIVKVISLIGVCCFGLFHGLSEEIVLIMFGKQWQGAVVSVHIFSWCIWAQLVNALAGSIYQSLGNTKEMFHSGLIHVALTIVAIIIGTSFQSIQILSFAVMISLNLKFIVESIYLIKKCFDYSLLAYWKNFIPEFFMMIVIAAVDEIMNSICNLGLIYSAVIKVMILGGLIFALTFALKQQKYILTFVPARFKKKKS